MPTHSTWRGVVANLREATAPVTPGQRKLGTQAGIQLPKTLPKLIAAARLKAAHAAELCLGPVRQPTDSQLEFLSTLNSSRARDVRVLEDHLEAEAWIEFYLLKRRQSALERLQLEAGDIVEIKDSEGSRLQEVVSMTSEGRVYFRGGRGSREWPDRIKVRCRARDKSKKARELRKITANQASTRSRASEWSLAKEKELRRYKVTVALTAEDIEQLRHVIDAARDERPIQRFIESHPQVLAALLGGNTRFVVSHPQFGGKRIPDFLIADVDSRGINWVLVELETPLSNVTLQDHNLLEKHARKGVSQVKEWREWILANLELARRSQLKEGLGLIDIRPRSAGLVLVGRRSRLGGNASSVRFPISEDERIDVHTYDYLLERLEGILRFQGPSGLNNYLVQPWRDDIEDDSDRNSG